MSASDSPSIFDFLPDNLGTPAPVAERGRLVSMRAQYVVDLSVSLLQPLYDRRQPVQTRMGVHIDTASHSADMHEVRLSLSLQGTIDDTPVLEVELTYGGLTWSEGSFGGEELAMALHIDAAALLYPMARAIVIENVAQMGYPITIPTPNFHELYDRHLAGGGKTA